MVFWRGTAFRVRPARARRGASVPFGERVFPSLPGFHNSEECPCVWGAEELADGDAFFKLDVPVRVGAEDGGHLVFPSPTVQLSFSFHPVSFKDVRLFIEWLCHRKWLMLYFLKCQRNNQ